MKKIVVAVMLLLSVVSCCLLVSCGGEDGVKTTVHLSFRSGIYNLYDKDVEVATKADSENGPSVLDLLYTVIDEQNVPVTLNADNNVEKVGLFFATSYEGIDYYWTFTVNGKEVGGSLDTIYLKAGDKVAYNFVELTEDEEGKINIADYNCDSGVFEDKLYKQGK